MQFDLVPDTAEDEPPAKKQSTLTDRFADWQDDAPCTSAPKPVDDEMTEYLSSRFSVSDNPDPDTVLQWWKFNKERFPALSKLVHSSSVSPHPVRLQSGPLVSVGAFWSRDSRDWDRSPSATFSSSTAIWPSDSFVKLICFIR